MLRRRFVNAIHGRPARPTSDTAARELRHRPGRRRANGLLVEEPDVRRKSDCGPWDGDEHCDRRRLAVRDQQDAEPWEADHHPDGELHHWVLPIEFLDTGFLLRARECFVEVSLGFSGM